MNSFYRISKKATEDLDTIWIYTFNTWSREQADKYYWLIISKIEFIAHNFRIGKSIEYIKAGYRCFFVKSHCIFYKQGDDGIVEIVRILHQSMNVEDRLKND